MRQMLRVRARALLLMITLGSGAAGTVAGAQKPSSPTPMQHEKSRDMDAIHRLFGYTDKIKRTVTRTPTGVEAVTEAEDPKVARMIQEHARAMRQRMKNHQPIRAWDPLFAALFQNADKIKLDITNTQKGVRITETSDDPHTIQIIHAHADAVTGFIHDGMMGMAKRHEAPGKSPSAPHKEDSFQGKGNGITTCPVTGEPVDRKIKAQIKGKTVYFCCASCVAVAKKNPSRYLKSGQPAK